jgi:hypothetical protein
VRLTHGQRQTRYQRRYRINPPNGVKRMRRIFKLADEWKHLELPSLMFVGMDKAKGRDFTVTTRVRHGKVDNVVT